VQKSGSYSINDGDDDFGLVAEDEGEFFDENFMTNKKYT